MRVARVTATVRASGPRGTSTGLPRRGAEALPGTVFAAGGWTALGTAFSVYAALVGSGELYGVVGGVLLLVTWFYAANYVLLLGATLDAVLAGRTAGTTSYNRPPDASFRR